jgi:hypothetical protein
VTDVPSSARPPAPVIVDTIPTFRWQESADEPVHAKLRRGGGLRVYLDRPWFTSGDAEALGVLAWPGGALPDGVAPFVSLAGRDPIWRTGAPPAVLTADDVNAPVQAVERLRECSEPLRVLAHEVHFDAERGLWYADLDLAKVAGSSYFPFVRLALARYQANSVQAEDRLSPPVQTEPIQLPPHRSLHVTPAPHRLAVALDGLAPAGPKPNQVRVELQVFDQSDLAPGPGAAAPAGPVAPESIIAGWSTVYGASGTLGQQIRVDVPDLGPRPRRLVVREFESHPDRLGETGGTPPGIGRLVYADMIALTSG